MSDLQSINLREVSVQVESLIEHLDIRSPLNADQLRAAMDLASSSLVLVRVLADYSEMHIGELQDGKAGEWLRDAVAHMNAEAVDSAFALQEKHRRQGLDS